MLTMVNHNILREKMKLHLILLELEWMHLAFWTQKDLIINVCFLYNFILQMFLMGKLAIFSSEKNWSVNNAL